MEYNLSATVFLRLKLYTVQLHSIHLVSGGRLAPAKKNIKKDK